MKQFGRKATALLLLLAVVYTTGACGGESEVIETLTSDTTSAETTSRWLDDLPDDLDFNGEEIVIHTRGDALSMQEVDVAEQTGEVLEDAIYRRNRDIEERLNVKISSYAGAGWANYKEEVGIIRSSISAGDNQWQLIAGYAARVTQLILEGAFLPLDDMKYLDFDAPWWSITANSKVKISGDTYFMLGDASLLTVLGGANCLYQNDRIAAEFKIPDVPQLVLDGKWTIDKLSEITKTVYRDIDGDGTQNDKDLYGLITNIYNAGDSYYIASDLHSVTVNNGVPAFSPDIDRVSAVLDKIWPFFYEGSTVNAFAGNDMTKLREMFLNGQGLFLSLEVQSSYGTLRDCQDDFTILPYPKYDEKQDRYYVPAYNSATIWSIPVDNPNLDAAAAVLEALSAESYNKLASVYYETCLQDKYTRNEKSVEMLRVIRENLYIDDEHLYNGIIGTPLYVFREVLSSGNNTPASWYEENTSKIKAAIASTAEALIGNTEK